VTLGIIFDITMVMPYTHDPGSADAVPRRLIVVLWLGESPAESTLADLYAQGIGVIRARDAAHGAELLTQFRPHAVVSAGTDEVLLFSDPIVPLIVAGTTSGTGKLPPHAVRAPDSTPHTLATTINHVVRTRAERPTTAA
jgi:hypothetical protein